MKQYTTTEQSAKLIKLGLPKPKSIVEHDGYWGYNYAYSIGELIEMLPKDMDCEIGDIGLNVENNIYETPNEWIMYQNIRQICDGMNIEFIIPESELALVQTPDKKRYIFCHGYQVQSKGTGTVAGIYPALGRLSMKWQRTFAQDKIFLGHYHTCVSLTSATVNGSIIGYNAFALSNGMGYEEPAQMYEVFANGRQLLNRKIYCI